MKNRRLAVLDYIEDLLTDYHKARIEFDKLTPEEVFKGVQGSAEKILRYSEAKYELVKWIDTEENWEDLVDQAEEHENEQN